MPNDHLRRLLDSLRANRWYDPRPVLSREMKGFLHHVGQKVVVGDEEAYKARRLDPLDGDSLLAEALQLGFVVAEDLRTSLWSDETGIALTAKGYSRIDMQQPPRMTLLQAEYVRQRLHELIPASHLEADHLLLRYDPVHHERLREALEYGAHFGLYTQLLDLWPDNTVAIVVAPETDAAKLEKSINDKFDKHHAAGARQVAFAVMPKMLARMHRVFHSNSSSLEDMLILDAIEFLDHLRKQQHYCALCGRKMPRDRKVIQERKEQKRDSQ